MRGKYTLSSTGKLFTILTLIGVVALAIWYVVANIHPYNPLYGNCGEYKAHGIENIRKGSEYYSPSLDRDGDGIACESYTP